jgi:hypothetical protein
MPAMVCCETTADQVQQGAITSITCKKGNGGNCKQWRRLDANEILYATIIELELILIGKKPSMVLKSIVVRVVQHFGESSLEAQPHALADCQTARATQL